MMNNVLCTTISLTLCGDLVGVEEEFNGGAS